MKNVFLCLINKGKSAAKYFIFSTLFVLLGLLGVSNVEAAYAPSDFAYNNSDSITNSCVATNLPNSYISYTLISSNYNGTNLDQECVSYSYGNTKYFYLKATDERTGNPNTTNLQTIQFKIAKAEVSGGFKYIAIFEEANTLADTVLYDLYTLTGTDTFSYQLVKEDGNTAVNQDTFYEAGNDNKGHISTDDDYYIFSYALRNPSYGANSVSVHFYNPVESTSNPTRRTIINFHLARPIADFSSELVTSETSCTGATGDAESGTFVSGKICLIYNNSATLTTGTNTIQVIIPKNAAFYFSTYLAQGKDIDSLDKDNIVDNLKYNSIYAVNTFTNTDETVVRYYYHNVADNTAYIEDSSGNDATNSKINTSGKYNMQLTMDALGSYQFFITDIFNTKNETTAKVVVTDTSNREIDIWFIDSLGVYEAFKNNGDDTDSAEFFKVIPSENNLTNKNIQIIIELYYTILIQDQYAIWDKTSSEIKSNPLENNELNRTTSSYCRSIADGDSYSSCYTGSSATQFNKHTINGNQEITATYAGLDTLFSDDIPDQYGGITNEFTLEQGAVSGLLTGINRTHAWVNENGRFVFEIFDTFGNTRIAWIDVSVIDQLQPTITTTASNTSTTDSSTDRIICTSTYVYGGNSPYAAPIYAGTDVNCGAQNVVYDATPGVTQPADTGKKDTSRFLLNEIDEEVTNAKFIYYHTEGARSFNYEDAIRIARLIAYDSITKSGVAAPVSRDVYKASNATFTDYTLTAGAQTAHAGIISGLFLQYASGLDVYGRNGEQLQIRIYMDHLSEFITFSSGDNICNSDDNYEECYNIVNNYIDRATRFNDDTKGVVSFTIYINAIDAVGNVSDNFTVNVEVKDDTTPGIATIDASTGAITNATPDIQTTNLDTTCRLEIGNKVQSKEEILKCYGFLVESTYNFVDNKSGLQGTAGNVSHIDYEDTNFAEVLSYQWYAKYSAYDINVKVQIELDGTWKDIKATRNDNENINNAGYYKLRFVITDNKLTASTTDTNYDNDNSTTLVVWYYVNPKVLLIAPNAQIVEYGTKATILRYDVYTSANDEAFYTNPFSVSADQLPTFLKNYTKADTSNDDYLSLDDRTMAGTLQVVDKKLHDAAGGATWTSNGKEINDLAVVNAGSYYITLGNICVTSATNCSSGVDADNYIIRLHPAYLINGKTPDADLKSYNHDDVEENVSNIYLTIHQKVLNVSANGGSKMYGVVDTNYLYYDTTDAVTNSNEKLAYLNGYSVNGFVNVSGWFSEDVRTTYSSASIITGTLRRVAGEQVGSYAICNVAGEPTDYTTTECSSNNVSDDWSTLAARTIDVTTSKVYYYNGTNYTQVTSISNDLSNVFEGYYVYDGSNYYKVTYENFDKNNGKLSVYDDIWKRTYNNNVYDEDNSDSNLAIKVAVNTTNENQNYVISYTVGDYVINTRELVVQPGINQGKEYSNPEHMDPIWQLVVYGEVEEYIIADESDFTGYTVTLKDVLKYEDESPTYVDYNDGPGNKADDTQVYFNRRKKTNTSSDYVYNYTYTIPVASSIFTLDGVEYIILTEKVCRNTRAASESECYTPVNDIYTIGGLNSFTIDGNTITVTLKGRLVYQNYTLFTNSSKESGKGTISRADPTEHETGWYAFDDDLSNLLVKEDNLNSDGANYTRSYNDNAPTRSVVGGKNVYTTTEDLNTSNIYSPQYGSDGSDEACTGDFYSVPCSGSYLHEDTTPSDRANNATSRVLFEIFKRDIIISFNYQDDNYGYAYADYRYWYFDFTSTDNTTPVNNKGTTMITCYMKANESNDLTGKTIYKVNNVDYIAMDSCNGDEHGLAISDNWSSGSNGLGLKFRLDMADDNDSSTTTTGETMFNASSGYVYALPAGLHYVSATITNENYRLVYVDYYTIRTADEEDTAHTLPNNGAIDILSSKVNLTATNYQKEYGQAIYKTYLDGSDWNASIVNIFDLNYVGCQIAAGAVNVGCGYDGGTSNNEQKTANTINGMGSQLNKNKYNALTNVYGYTVSAMDNTYVVAGGTANSNADLTVITDTIYNNFFGLPDRARYANNSNADDKYGLLDAVGIYTIDLDDILTTYAKYSANDTTLLGVSAPNLGSAAEVSTTNTNHYMITRYTNYYINSKETGSLYILPAEIQIEVVSGQTKMYGCAYNGTLTGTISWTREGGYTNCDESIGDYYDFGYTYKVYGDKTFELLDNSSALLKSYDSFNVANTIADFGSVNDISYKVIGTTPSYTVQGIVKDHDNGVDMNDISYTVIGQADDVVISNSSLNNGVLYRAKIGATDNKYSYSSYWKYANDALTKASGYYKGFQDQSVGSYVLTLGNLDAVFNSNNQCSASSQPDSAGTNGCKNYIVYKMEKSAGSKNIAATHTRTNAGVESISDTDLDHIYSVKEFEITTRDVKVHTEYNYKVYGDTDSLEGFTCKQIAAMYTRGASSSYYNKGVEFSFVGRDGYFNDLTCSIINDEKFINMGTARYYAVDNSLAKAPWTSWSDSRQTTSEVTTPSSYYLYDDILWDVLKGILSRTNANGNKATTNTDQYNTGGINDKVGTYLYDWSNITLRNSNDYTRTILKDNTKDQGFYVKDGNDVMQRWYLDDRHYQLKKETVSSYDYYSFTIKKTADAATEMKEFAGNYPYTDISKDYGEVYYEVVKREIIVVVDDVEKDYGIEDTYALFTIKLCSSYEAATGTCTLAAKEDAYGNRNALSTDDYAYFINADGSYNQERIKGYTSSTGYGRFKGSETDNESYTVRGSFGIFYNRVIGEQKGTYTVMACPNQSGETSCAMPTGSHVYSVFEAGDDGENYNAANYIITSYTGSLTINERKLTITPDADQGFQYGNYETNTKIAPITYTESYTELGLSNGAKGYHGTANDVSGLVNGKIGVDADGDAVSDSLTTQYALCLFDISGIHQVCINDRQNSTVNNTHKNATYTRQYIASSSPTNAMPTVAAANINWVYNNVYNDDYNDDRDETRYALNREIGSKTNQRYNRNVGVYTIVVGELLNNTRYNASTQTTNYLNNNYVVTDFTTGVTYKIEEANVTVTPNSGQSKIYGQKDVELTFEVTTSFTTPALPVDWYYCGANQDACKQTFTKTDSTDYAGNASVEFEGFAYSEDIGTYTSETHNYGQARVSNKIEDYDAKINQPSANIGEIKYFDKYCLTGTSGSYSTEFDEFTCESSGRTLTYTAATNRILLGYLYVEGWSQKAGESATANGEYKILNGMVVAYNEHAEPGTGTKEYKNYRLNFELDADTTEKFVIDKLDLAIDIVDIVKTYGEATDGYKCESGNCTIRIPDNTEPDNPLLTASDHENRLEYNFNVTNVNTSAGKYETGVYTDTSNNDILLINPINGKYYTQTASAEYKNTHIGIRVVRESGAARCSVSVDEYGCEDVDTYQLKFVKAVVADNVDYNYNLHIGKDEIVAETTNNETLKNTYISITQGVSKDTASAFAETDKFVTTVADFATLTINKRNVTFYIGTYTPNELVDGRYTIEQDEMAPELPKISDSGIGYLGQISTSGPTSYAASKTNPESKQVYYVTWFDNNNVYREVRTSDAILTTYESSDTNAIDLYGIAYCKVSIESLSKTSVDAVDMSVCGAGNMIYSDKANAQDTNNAYYFDTSLVGTYAILRDKQVTGIGISGVNDEYGDIALYESKNYTTIDKNGVLVIYEDSTAPIIEVGNDEFTLEANAEVTCTTTGGTTTCTIAGKQVTISEDQADINTIGNVIKYITQNFSSFISTNKNIVLDKQLNGSIARNNDSKFAGYCKKDTATGCTELFYPVNNPGITSGTTGYNVDRTANDYDWNGTVIDSHLRAITSVVSWFNVTSYDYGYIRNNAYATKRYTPRYYMYVNGSTDNTLAAFDPRYVGDFTISIYAVDNMGNVSEATSVTLHIKDETKPVVGNLYVFNTPVKCTISGSITAKDCATNINNWVVDTSSDLYVDINSFIKYSDTSGTIDDLNGTYIYINGGYRSLFGDVVRYTKLSGGGYSQSVTGRYIKLTSSDTVSALQVEHRYWNNTDYVYVVVTGGSDNSYLNKDSIGDSQWHHYYKVNTSWYKYDRTSLSSVKVSTNNGINDIVTTVIDSGRTVGYTTNNVNYYDAMYLLYVSGGTVESICSTLNPNCENSGASKEIEGQKEIALVSNKFNILGVEYTLSTDHTKVTWGSSQEELVDATTRKFTSGIMTCEFSSDFSMITSCLTEYEIVYKPADKKSVEVKDYDDIDEALNMSDFAPEVTNGYYRDRKYIYIDKDASVTALNSQGYMIYEFGCPEGSCETPYAEKYFNTAEKTDATKGVLAATGVTALSTGSVLTKLGTLGTYDIKGYTGSGTTAGTISDTTLTSSGVPLTGTSNVMNASRDSISGANHANAVNYFYTAIDVYLAVRNGADEDNDYYKYTVLWNGAKFIVYRVTGTSASGYAYVLTYGATTNLPNNGSTVNHDDIFDLLPKIVSEDDSIKATTGTEYHFDINYSVYDIAGNKSITLVRGVTFIDLSSLIDINVDIQAAAPANAGVAMVNNGNNVYTITANQGVSLSTLVNSISISNINNDGVNNMDTVKQALYYNGEVLFEGVSYNENVFDLIQDYASTPGTYTLRLTSTRQANSVKTEGLTYMVEDKPLEINFVIKPAVASVNDNGDYSSNVAIIMSMALATMFLMGLGYISLKRIKK